MTPTRLGYLFHATLWLLVLAIILALGTLAGAAEHRSSASRHHFEVMTGFPHGRPGYWIDHIRPLDCGGADNASNMAWQRRADAMAKDKFERQDCSVWLNPNPPCWIVNVERDEICRLPHQR